MCKAIIGKWIIDSFELDTSLYLQDVKLGYYRTRLTYPTFKKGQGRKQVIVDFKSNKILMTNFYNDFLELIGTKDNNFEKYGCLSQTEDVFYRLWSTKKYSIDEPSKLCRFFADGEIFSKEIFIDKEMTLIYNIEKFLDLSSVLKGNIS